MAQAEEIRDVEALRRPVPFGRWAIYVVLVAFAAFYLVPLIVTLPSVRTERDISSTSVVGREGGAVDEKAWGSYCVARRCEGISPYMWNSILMVVPATIISTLLGALNGYSISLWRFRGDNWIFGIITLGVFLPEQMKLVPWTRVVRDLGLSNTLTALVVIHVIQGISFTTLFCRNYYVAIPPELLKAAGAAPAIPHLLAHRAAAVAADPDRHGDLAVHLYLNGFPRRHLHLRAQPVTATLIALSVSVPRHRNMASVRGGLIAALPTLLVYLFGENILRASRPAR